jgi:hypothetical protein
MRFKASDANLNMALFLTARAAKRAYELQRRVILIHSEVLLLPDEKEKWSKKIVAFKFI